jgi:hypothetical protein
VLGHPAQILSQALVSCKRPRIEVERLDSGEYRLVRVAPAPKEGLVDWLLACPEKGYFVPIESEPTNTL